MLHHYAYVTFRGPHSGVTQGWCHRGRQLRVSPLLFFPEKKLTTFFSHHRLSVLQCHRYLFFSEKLTTFFFPFCSSLSLLLISLSYHPQRVSPRTFFTSPTSFVHDSLQIHPQLFSFWCHPLKGITRGGPSRPHPPSDATAAQ